MRLMLRGLVTPTWEDVAPEGKRTNKKRNIRSSGRAIYLDLLIRYRLYVAWTSGRVISNFIYIYIYINSKNEREILP